MREVTQKSVVPVYAAAALWVLWALVLPFYRLWHFALAAALSVVVYLVFSRIFPPKTVLVREKEKPADTGDRGADALIDEGRARLRRLRALNDAIADEAVSAQIARLESVCGRIFDYVAQNPKKTPQLRRFLNYYLPTTVKLLDSYSQLAKQEVRGENIGGTMRSIESMLSTIGDAFEKQLDHLFADEALDISTDITVLESMMAQEGLTGRNITEKGPENERKM